MMADGSDVTYPQDHRALDLALDAETVNAERLLPLRRLIQAAERRVVGHNNGDELDRRQVVAL
jgi:hypothetical protein